MVGPSHQLNYFVISGFLQFSTDSDSSYPRNLVNGFVELRDGMWSTKIGGDTNVPDPIIAV
ncbi:hypothetical protein PHLCEN_2v2637 [Hermanssonia centrifuga]|uniref:Uncharacterized protein n=1 Tax=Hermanssonia centrifuga TaxID=98765 RepID=A0A2R6RIM2_9APHY|nr:hypothetical protein PHLCEN_2v2637 [Hermanssonia centrifuga]